MSAFTVRKLYIDCVDRNGVIWIFYFADLSIFGFRQRVAGVERYPPDAPGSFHRVPGAIAWPAAPAAGAPLRFQWQLPEGPVEFEGVSMFAPWRPAAPPSGLAFDWHVVAPRLHVRLRSWYSGSSYDTGVGYADFVSLRRPPRWLGLRDLRWGRAHDANGAIAFSSVIATDGANWQRAARWDKRAQPTVWEKFALEERTAGGLTLRPLGASAVAGLEFHFAAQRSLHSGDPMDARRFPRALERLGYRFAMGPAREVRSAGPARFVSAGGTIPADGIHEWVRFG